VDNQECHSKLKTPQPIRGKPHTHSLLNREENQQNNHEIQSLFVPFFWGGGVITIMNAQKRVPAILNDFNHIDQSKIFTKINRA